MPHPDSVYQHETELGTFRIVARTDIGVALWLDEEWLGTYASAADAASDVATGSTGHRQWDRTHARRSPPADLSAWQHLRDGNDVGHS